MGSKFDTDGPWSFAELGLQEVELSKPATVGNGSSLKSREASFGGREGERVRPNEGIPSEAAMTPRIDIGETDEVVFFLVELAGMTDKDVDVLITRDTLTIRGNRPAEDMAVSGWLLRERASRVVERVVLIPDGVDTDDASMQFRNGLLIVRMAKSHRLLRKSRVYSS